MLLFPNTQKIMAVRIIQHVEYCILHTQNASVYLPFWVIHSPIIGLTKIHLTCINGKRAHKDTQSLYKQAHKVTQSFYNGAHEDPTTFHLAHKYIGCLFCILNTQRRLLPPNTKLTIDTSFWTNEGRFANLLNPPAKKIPNDS